MVIKNVCCIGADCVGGIFSSVIAFKCPNIDVHVIDPNEEKLKQWNLETISIFEPGLEDLIKKNRDRNLFFTTDPSPLKNADIIFVCTETDFNDSSLLSKVTVQLKALEEAARLIVRSTDCSKIVVEKSKVGFQATEVMNNIFKAHEEPYRKFTLISNPEFITDCCDLRYFLNPEKVLIGSNKTPETAGAVETLIKVYENWVPRSKIITTDLWSMEMSSLAEAVFLAQEITSINILLEICEVTDADVNAVIEAIAMYSGILLEDLKANIGIGGVNLYKKACDRIIYLCESFRLPEMTMFWRKLCEINDHQNHRFIRKINEAFSSHLTDRCVVVLGFSLKKDTARTRESAAIFICKVLLEEGAKLKICDPEVPPDVILKDLVSALYESDLAEKIPNLVNIIKDPYDAARGAHALILCTNWDQFVNLDFHRIFTDMEKPAHIFDGKNVLPARELQKIGFLVQTLGMNNSSSEVNF